MRDVELNEFQGAKARVELCSRLRRREGAGHRAASPVECRAVGLRPFGVSHDSVHPCAFLL
ncbi:hypothetical protein OKW11_005701 [Pseudomonas baetica]|nr:hypothetical protein [Pseudomonas baetica]